MEPDCTDPDDVEHYKHGIRECLLNPCKTVSRVNLLISTDNLCEHHVVPEIVEVQQQADKDDQTEYEQDHSTMPGLTCVATS